MHISVEFQPKNLQSSKLARDDQAGFSVPRRLVVGMLLINLMVKI